MYEYNTNLWTSILKIIDYDDTLCDEFCNSLVDVLRTLGLHYNKFINKNPSMEPHLMQYLLAEGCPLDDVVKFASYQEGLVDYTGLMKGYALSILRDKLVAKTNSFLVDFGGDIVGWNTPEVKYINKEFSVSIRGNYSIFYSSNDSLRGRHIVGNSDDASYVVISDKCDKLITQDMCATELVAYNVSNYKKFKTIKLYNNNGKSIHSESILQ